MEKYETAVLQYPEELEWFLELIKRENVHSYLEIGSKFGGSLWCVANALPQGSKVVAVDLPAGDGSFKESQQSLEDCVATLKTNGYDASLFLGDSTDLKIVDAVSKLGPFDLCFIDANHTLPYVTADWKNYGSLAYMVAFHDISGIGSSTKKKKHIQVPLLWNVLKQQYRHEEKSINNKHNGIGVLWRL